jgi:hypothetical protein
LILFSIRNPNSGSFVGGLVNIFAWWYKIYIALLRKGIVFINKRLI